MECRQESYLSKYSTLGRVLTTDNIKVSVTRFPVKIRIMMIDHKKLMIKKNQSGKLVE